MPWGEATRRPACATIGLDLNASRARAASGSISRLPARALPLGDTQLDLPLIISLDDRLPAVGWPGYQIVRQWPHLVCRDYLPLIGKAREWRGPKCRLDLGGAIEATVECLKGALPRGSPLGLVLPAYLTDVQASQLLDVFDRVGLPIAGSAAAPMAIALTNDSHFGSAMVLDVDEHALTWTVLIAEGLQVRMLAHHAMPGAGARAWFDRLIDAISDRCVRLCRRDPRDSAVAEQSLFEQLDNSLTAATDSSPIMLHLRTPHWFQELKLARDDLDSFAAPLVRLALDGMRQAAALAHAAAPVMPRPDELWITADAARLPGLVAAASEHVPESTAMRVLPPEASAVAAAQIAQEQMEGDWPAGHVNAAGRKRNMAILFAKKNG